MKNNQLREKIKQTRRGVSSLYVVIFATVLFGVVTVSFTRLIISEALQSSNDDLSQSAYDSAVAGVEDAKVAVNQYYDCIRRTAVEGNEEDDDNENKEELCEDQNVFSEEPEKEDCANNGFPLGRKLHGSSGEVLIQETGGNQQGDTFMDQAYTCVIISDVTSDYRGTLTSDSRTRVVPLSANGSGINSGSIGQVSKIKFGWYSELNQGSSGLNLLGKDGANDYDTEGNTWKLDSYNDRVVPPAIQLTLIKTPANITISDLYKADNDDNVIDSSMLLLPVEYDNEHATTMISKTFIEKAGNAISGYSAEYHKPVGIKCKTGQEFICNAELEIENLDDHTSLFASDSNVFLIVNIPYGDAFTDFKIELIHIDENGNESTINFKGAQISVDSTGRTNQLYRRVEARLDPADQFFPYPEFEISNTGGAETGIEKHMWVTANCWRSWYGGDTLEVEECNQNGKLSQ